MNVHTFKRPRVYIPTALVVLLIIIMLIIFNASFQKNLLLKYAGQEMDSLSVDHIHLTPWSIQIENLQAEQDEAELEMKQLEDRMDEMMKKKNSKVILKQ